MSEDPTITAIRDAFVRGVNEKLLREGLSVVPGSTNHLMVKVIAEGVVEALREYERRFLATTKIHRSWF